MAEGFAHTSWPKQFKAYSAGIEKHGMNANAMQVMAESGVDISQQHSKTLAEIETQQLDYVITVCGHAHETCPVFHGDAMVIHQGFDDPPKLAEGLSGEEALNCYRKVRDQIQAYVSNLPTKLTR